MIINTKEKDFEFAKKAEDTTRKIMTNKINFMKPLFISFHIGRCFRITMMLLFIVIAIQTQAQQFKVVEDTIRINAADYISPISEFTMKWSAKYHGFYFCIFKDQQIYDHWIWRNRLLVISEDRKDIVEVSLPKDFQGNYYGDLFVRHDTLYLSPYHLRNEQGGYYFDMDTWQWIPVEVVSNVIYDDDQYSVAVVDMGEWGAYTWFMEKKISYVDTRYSTPQISTNIWESSTSVTVKPAQPRIEEFHHQYIMPEKLSRIIKKDNVYFFIRSGKVDTLISLKGKAQLCKNDHTYEAVVRDGYKYLYSLGTWKSPDSLSITPVPTLFHFTDREDKDSFWGEKTYDTVFSDAFLTNGDIYYLINTKKKTYIAQLENGKLLNKFDFGRQYPFFQTYDCFRGNNPAPNQCFKQFKEDKNSFGVLEIQDTLIHIRHILHNQDSLPHVGTDNIEPLLQFLLNHLDHLTLSQTDSVEKALQATCQGELKELANLYYPDEYQTGEYERYSYYTVVDSKKTLSVNYCVHKSDSVVKGVFFEWLKTNIYNLNTRSSGKMDNVETKHTEVCKILTHLTGKEPVKKIERSTYLLWEYYNITIKLYEDGRMVMYLTEE